MFAEPPPDAIDFEDRASTQCRNWLRKILETGPPVPDCRRGDPGHLGDLCEPNHFLVQAKLL